MKISYIFLTSISFIFSSFIYGQATPSKDTLSIVAVGDVMIGSGFPAGNLPKDDAKGSFKAVKPYLKGDIVFGNLEGAILDSGNSEMMRNFVKEFLILNIFERNRFGVCRDIEFNFLKQNPTRKILLSNYVDLINGKLK